MANANESIEIEPSQGTDGDRRMKLAIALTKQIQTKVANLTKVLQIYGEEHQPKQNLEQKLEEEGEVAKLEVEKVPQLEEEEVPKLGQAKVVEETTEIELNRIAMKDKNGFDKLQSEVKALKRELSEKNSELSDAVKKVIQLRRLAKKYKNSFHELQSDVKALKRELSEKNSELSDAINNGIQLRRLAKKYKNSYSNLYEKNLLEENRARIVALTYSSRMSSRFAEVAELVMHWEELDTKMQQIIEQNSKPTTGDGLKQENGIKRHRDSDGEDSNNKKVAGYQPIDPNV